LTIFLKAIIMAEEVKVDVFSPRDTTDFLEERRALASAEFQMAKLEREFPDWWALFDDTLPDMAPRAEVVELMLSAPNPFALGLLYGKFTMRQEIAAITKREWV